MALSVFLIYYFISYILFNKVLFYNTPNLITSSFDRALATTEILLDY